MFKYCIGIILTIMIFFYIPSFGQRTSLAQPQLIPTLDYRSPASGAWYFGLTLDYNNLSKLVMGDEELDDETRSRSTRALEFRALYGLSDRIFISAIFSGIQKVASLRLPTVGLERLVTRGLGDTYLLGGYTIAAWKISSGHSLIVGSALKLPTGATDYHSDEIAIHEDMQPGTGSYDWAVWGNAISRLHPASPANLIIDALYKINGRSIDDYKFGNEFALSAGLMFLPEYPGHFAASVKYLHIGRQESGENITISNTGGKWLFFVWDVKADLKKYLFGRLIVEFPMMEHLKGSQLTTSFAVSFSIQYAFYK